MTPLEKAFELINEGNNEKKPERSRLEMVNSVFIVVYPVVDIFERTKQGTQSKSRNKSKGCPDKALSNHDDRAMGWGTMHG